MYYESFGKGITAQMPFLLPVAKVGAFSARFRRCAWPFLRQPSGLLGMVGAEHLVLHAQ